MDGVHQEGTRVKMQSPGPWRQILQVLEEPRELYFTTSPLGTLKKHFPQLY